jgi:hypothetical protein
MPAPQHQSQPRYYRALKELVELVFDFGQLLYSVRHEIFFFTLS